MRSGFIFVACAIAQIMFSTAARADNWVIEHVTLIDGRHALQPDMTIADINNAKSIVLVMKNGQLIDESQLPLAGGKQRRRFTGS
jgi:hypothetical protein